VQLPGSTACWIQWSQAWPAAQTPPTSRSSATTRGSTTAAGAPLRAWARVRAGCGGRPPLRCWGLLPVLLKEDMGAGASGDARAGSLCAAGVAPLAPVLLPVPLVVGGNPRSFGRRHSSHLGMIVRIVTCATG
jgi:hypothetical protein